MTILKKILTLFISFVVICGIWKFIKQKRENKEGIINEKEESKEEIIKQHLPKWHGNDCAFQSTILQIYCILDYSRELYNYCKRSNNKILKNVCLFYENNYLKNNVSQNYNDFYQPFYDLVVEKINNLDLNNFNSISIDDLENLNIMISGFPKLAEILAIPCLNLIDLKINNGDVNSIQQFIIARQKIKKNVDTTVDSGMTLKVLFTILKYCNDTNLKISKFTMSLFNKNIFFVSDDFNNNKGELISYQMYLKIGNVGHASCVYKNILNGKFYFLCCNTNVNITNEQFENHNYLEIINLYKQKNKGNGINYEFESKGDILYKL